MAFEDGRVFVIASSSNLRSWMMVPSDPKNRRIVSNLLHHN